MAEKVPLKSLEASFSKFYYKQLEVKGLFWVFEASVSKINYHNGVPGP